MSEFHKNWKKFLAESKDNEEESSDNEELSPEQSDEMDKDKDGDIDGDDLKKLRKEGSSMYPTQAIVDIIRQDPEFDLLQGRADQVEAALKQGADPYDALESVYPDWVPGQLLQAVIQKAESDHQIPHARIAEEDADAPSEEGDGMNMRNDVKKVVQFLFHKSEQVSAYMEKIKGDKTESAQLIAHMLNELGMSVQEFNQILPKVKQNMAEAKYKDIVRKELKKVFR